jgi:hypothetical protein
VQSLIDTASELGVEVSVRPEQSPTHFPHAGGLTPSVIDLMFLPQDYKVGLVHNVCTDWKGPLDYALLCATLPIVDTDVVTKRLAMPKDSDEELSFLAALADYLSSMDTDVLDTSDAIEQLVSNFATTCSQLWNEHAKTIRIHARSKSW